jgi:DNA helicase-2/ATP-dependent DNA helicase PcrA
MFSDLNEKQKEAVEYGRGPLLIVAGAGSGKTKTLTSRLAYLIAAKKVNPEKILAITFTNKAADEMKERVKKAIEKENIKITKEPFVGTFHSFGARILRKESRLFGRSISFSIFDDVDSLSLIKKILKNLNISTSNHAPASLMREFSRIKSELLDEKSFLGNKKLESVWYLFKEYERVLEKNNAFDFDDLIEKPVRLFKKNREILKKYQSQHDYVLVDEYQDINTAQYLLVKLLVYSHNNINVVGDDQQAIYGFRFSDFRNFLNFEKDWPKAKLIFLEQNYRSTKNIIESSSALIAKNLMQKPKNLWTENEEGGRIRIVEHDDEFSEADFIVQNTQTYLKKGMNVGILFRTNAQSRALEQLFLEYGIKYNLFGALTFYERKEIKDIVAGLRYSLNPADEISLSRLEKNFYKKTYLKLKDELPKKSKMKPAQIIAYFVKATGYTELLKKNYENYLERLENVQELSYFSEQFEDLAHFIEKVSLAHPLDDQKRKRNKKYLEGANLMTIHLAKGLEFDVVFVTGVNEGILPHQRSLFLAEDMEEERRLMYVAMTRAKKELYLNFYHAPSRFLSELPSNYLEFSGDKALDDEERYIEYD